MAIQKIKCSNNFGNTGVGDCYLVPDHIVGEIIVPSSFALEDDDEKTILEQLQEAAEEDNPRKRIYPIHNFEEVEDNSEDETVNTFGYGGRSITKDGFYDWRFRFVKGGLCLSNQLRRYNKQSVSVILIDANGVLFGQLVDGKLKGIPLELFYIPKWKISDGDSDGTGFYVQNVMNPIYLNERIGFVDTQSLGFIPSEIKGLQTITFKNAGSDTSKIVVEPLAGCGSENLTEIFDDELEDSDLWELIDGSNGSDIDITSVNIVNGKVEISPDEPFSIGDQIIVNTKKVSELIDAGIIGFEGEANKIKIEDEGN